MSHYANFAKVIGGLEMDLEVEFEVISYGSPASWDDPGDGPEIEIIAIRTECGRDLTELCNTTKDWYGEPSRIGIVRFHHGMHEPSKWVHGVGFVTTGPRQPIVSTEHGYPMLDDAIYNEICVNHMPDYDYDPDDWR